jgi:hypothetical protein
VVNKIEDFSETFQLKVYTFENFNVISTHKIASSVVKDAYLKDGIDYFKIDLDVDFVVVNDFKNNSLKFNNIINSDKKIYFLYRNPISRCISAFFQNYQNEHNFNFWIADDENDIIFEKYKYLLEFFSETELINYNKEVGRCNGDMELLVFESTNTIYLDIFKKLLIDDIMDKFKKGSIRLSTMNSPYLLSIYKLIKDFNINYSLIDIDTDRFDLILEDNLKNYKAAGYINYKPKIRNMLESTIRDNDIISNILHQLHFDETFIYNELNKISNNNHDK